MKKFVALILVAIMTFVVFAVPSSALTTITMYLHNKTAFTGTVPGYAYSITGYTREAYFPGSYVTVTAVAGRKDGAPSSRVVHLHNYPTSGIVSSTVWIETCGADGLAVSALSCILQNGTSKTLNGYYSESMTMHCQGCITIGDVRYVGSPTVTGG